MASVASKTRLRDKNVLAKEQLRKRELIERQRLEKPFMNNADPDKAKNIYSFHVRDIHGQPVSLEKYKDYICLFVNIAITNSFSMHNFITLKTLCAKFGDEKFRILLFPCNQFDQPEVKIPTRDYVKYINNYGGLDAVDLYGKIKVNCGRSSPVWYFLKKNVNIGAKRVIKSPYVKFVVNQYGEPVARLGPEAQRDEIDEVLTRCGLHGKPSPHKKYAPLGLMLHGFIK